MLIVVCWPRSGSTSGGCERCEAETVCSRSSSRSRATTGTPRNREPPHSPYAGTHTHALEGQLQLLSHPIATSSFGSQFIKEMRAMLGGEIEGIWEDVDYGFGGGTSRRSPPPRPPPCCVDGLSSTAHLFVVQATRIGLWSSARRAERACCCSGRGKTIRTCSSPGTNRQKENDEISIRRVASFWLSGPHPRCCERRGLPQEGHHSERRCSLQRTKRESDKERSANAKGMRDGNEARLAPSGAGGMRGSKQQTTPTHNHNTQHDKGAATRKPHAT